MSTASPASFTVIGSGTMEGTLSKWTNVMKGWQYRFFVLDENAGLLSYYTVSMFMHLHVYACMCVCVCFCFKFEKLYGNPMICASVCVYIKSVCFLVVCVNNKFVVVKITMYVFLFFISRETMKTDGAVGLPHDKMIIWMIGFCLEQ